MTTLLVKEQEWNLFSFSDEEVLNTIKPKTEEIEINLVKTTETITEVCEKDDVNETEEENFDMSEVGNQPYECGAIVRFVSKKGKKEEILTGVVYGHGWNAGNPDIKGPADNILIRTDDNKSLVTPKRFVLEIVEPVSIAV